MTQHTSTSAQHAIDRLRGINPAVGQPAKLLIVGFLVLAIGIGAGMAFAQACSALFRLVG